jgi:hypothetical protein
VKDAKPRPILSKPSVLICHEKHGEVYFLVNDDEDLFRVALSIVRGRLKAGWWYGEPGDAPTPPDFTKEDVECCSY